VTVTKTNTVTAVQTIAVEPACVPAACDLPDWCEADNKKGAGYFCNINEKGGIESVELIYFAPLDALIYVCEKGAYASIGEKVCLRIRSHYSRLTFLLPIFSGTPSSSSPSPSLRPRPSPPSLRPLLRLPRRTTTTRREMTTRSTKQLALSSFERMDKTGDFMRFDFCKSFQKMHVLLIVRSFLSEITESESLPLKFWIVHCVFFRPSRFCGLSDGQRTVDVCRARHLPTSHLHSPRT